MPCRPSRNKTLAMEIKDYPEKYFKVFWACSILLDLFTLLQIIIVQHFHSFIEILKSNLYVLSHKLNQTWIICLFIFFISLYRLSRFAMSVKQSFIRSNRSLIWKRSKRELNMEPLSYPHINYFNWNPDHR